MSKRKPLKQRIAELDARRQTLVAMQRKQQRTRDTRRKILLGAWALNRLDKDSQLSSDLRNWLQSDLGNYLTRQSDINLFDDILPPTETNDGN